MKKITLSILIIASAVLLSACGQKGPLVLKKVPTEQTQTPLENTNDVVPVEADSVDSDSE